MKKKKEVQEEKKAQVQKEPQVQPGDLEKFTRAVQEGMLQMDKRLKDSEAKVQQRDQQINEMAMFIKTQQSQPTEMPTAEAPESQAERDKPMTKGDLYGMAKDLIGLYRNSQTNVQQDEFVQMAVENQRAVMMAINQAMGTKIGQLLGLNPAQSPGVE